MSVRSFKDVNGELTRIAESVVNHLTSGSFKRRGSELVAGDMNGGPGESFALNVSKGTWADFADTSGDQAGDMIDYWAAVRGIKKGEAKREAEEWLYGQEPAPMAKADNYVPWKDGHMAGKWAYVTASGAPFMSVYRFNDPSKPGSKDFCPWDDVAKIWKMPDGMRPLYNLPAVMEAVSNGRQIIVVEGEKKADRLNALGFVATTSASGSRSAHKTEWTPLAGADVVIWPDHDAPGARYAEVVTERLKTVKAGSVRMVKPPAEKPEGWDAGDADDSECLGLIGEATAITGAEGVSRQGVRVELLVASDIRPEPIDWLWHGWLAAGKLHILAGSPGTGKTTLAIAMAATITTEGTWPDGTHAAAGTVLIWSGEDDPRDSIVPRLLACKADLTKVRFVGETVTAEGRRSFDPASDMDALLTAVESIPDLRLVMIDPIVSAVAGDSHKNAEVRRGLQPLVDLAGKRGCAVLGITHFSKGTQSRDPAERVTGSLAFGALARVVMCTAKPTEEDGKRLIVRAKSNIGPDGGGFEYDLARQPLADYPGVVGQCVLWGDSIDGTARELLHTVEQFDESNDGSALGEAVSFLRDLLMGGPLPAKQVESDADANGFSRATIRRAKVKLGVDIYKSGMKGGWSWRLPSVPHDHQEARSCSNEAEDSQQNDVNTFGNIEHLRQHEGPVDHLDFSEAEVF